MTQQKEMKKAADMTRDETKKYVLEQLYEMQESTSPITIQIGLTNKDAYVIKQEIILKKCPPAIIENLRKDPHLKDYIHFSVTEDGVVLEFF